MGCISLSVTSTKCSQSRIYSSTGSLSKFEYQIYLMKVKCTQIALTFPLVCRYVHSRSNYLLSSGIFSLNIPTGEHEVQTK